MVRYKIVLRNRWAKRTAGTFMALYISKIYC